MAVCCQKELIWSLLPSEDTRTGKPHINIVSNQNPFGSDLWNPARFVTSKLSLKIGEENLMEKTVVRFHFRLLEDKNKIVEIDFNKSINENSLKSHQKRIFTNYIYKDDNPSLKVVIFNSTHQNNIENDTKHVFFSTRFQPCRHWDNLYSRCVNS